VTGATDRPDGPIVEISERDGVSVVTVGGEPDERELVRLAGQLVTMRVAGRAAVVDLSAVMLHRPAAIGAFLARLGAASDDAAIPVVHARRTARQLLRRLGAGQRVAVLASVADALVGLRAAVPATGPSNPAGADGAPDAEPVGAGAAANLAADDTAGLAPA